MNTLATLPTTLYAGPAHSFSLHPGWGDTVIVTVLLRGKLSTPYGMGSKTISAAPCGCTTTFKLTIAVSVKGLAPGGEVTGGAVASPEAVGDGVVPGCPSPQPMADNTKVRLIVSRPIQDSFKDRSKMDGYPN